MSQPHSTATLAFERRAELPNTPALTAYLLKLMALKKTNLCLSADVTTTKELLEIAEQVGDYICIFKTHIDIITDFSTETVVGLRRLAAQKGFVIFEDRKLGDIGSTVQKQYAEGQFGIAKWAEITNAHIFPGPPIVTALSEAAKKAELSLYEGSGVSTYLQQLGPPPAHGLLLLAQMSSAGCLMTPAYTQSCVEVAREHRDFVIGFITMESLNTDSGDNFLSMSPGVKFVEPGADAGDGLGQQYNSPESKIVDKGIDVVIVGRGILNASDRVASAKHYCQAAWNAYEKRVNGN